MGEGLGLGAVDPRAPAAHEFDAYASDAEEREQAIEPSQLALELPTRLLCHRLRRLRLRLLGLDLPQLLLLGLSWAPLRRGGSLSLFPMLVDQEAVAAFADRLHPIPVHDREVGGTHFPRRGSQPFGGSGDEPQGLGFPRTVSRSYARAQATQSRAATVP